MRLRRKFLAGFTALTLLCAATYTGAAAADEDTVSENIEISEEVEENITPKVSERVSSILQALGIMDEGEIESAGYVSRGFAAEILLRFEEIYGSGTATGQMYNDVSADEPYSFAIEMTSEYGYFFGTGGGNFSPDANMTPRQMAVVLLRLAGYPDSSIASSSEFGKLLKNVGNYEYLTYSGLANMLYNFLDVNIVALTNFSARTPGYTQSGTETVLNDCFDVTKIKGVITENSVTGLWAGSSLRTNRVAITESGTSTVIDIGGTDIYSMIGRYVEAYCKYDKSNDIMVCVYYDASAARNNVTEIDLFGIDHALSDDNEIVYYLDDGKKQKVRYSIKTAVLWNGTYYSDTEAIIDKVNGKEGKIVAIDNDADKVADVLNVEVYETFIVSSVNLLNKTAFFKNTNKSLSLDQEEYDQFTLIDEKGNDFYVADFIDGMVVSVAQNSTDADKKIVKVLVSEKTVNGVVTAVHKNDLGRTVVQLDNIYEYILLNTLSEPSVGQGIIAMLNVFGRVAWIDYSNSGEYAYGIITDVKLNRKAGAVIVKMITAQNTIEKFEVATKLRVDNVAYKDMDSIYAKLVRTDNISVGNQKLPAGVYPVRYKLRADGTLAELDTDKRDAAAGEGENTLELLDSGYRMLLSDLVMGGVFALNSSTPVFSISCSTSGGVIEKDYFEDTQYMEMGNVSSLMSSAHKYNYAAYKVDKDSVYADFVIISSTWGQAYEDKLFVVEKISTVYDETSGTAVKCVQGMENGVERQLLVSSLYMEEFDAIGLVCGDVIRYKADGYGQLIFVENVGDCKWVVKHKLDDTPKTIDINNISSGRTSLNDFRNEAYSTQMIFGYVKERRGSFITLSVIQPNTHNLDGTRSSADMGKETVLIKIPDTTPITVFDPLGIDKVYAATYDEILDYKHNGNNCSLVALHFRTGRLMDAVVLNDYSLYK